MGYVITVALSVISAMLVFVLQTVIRENRDLRQKNRQDETMKQQALSDGVLSLLRIQLIEYHEKYMTRESIPVYVYENWDDMFKAYSGLGGNGTIRHMNEDVQKKRIGKNENH